MKIRIVTAFPDCFQSPLTTSILNRAQEKKIVDIQVIDLRRFTENKHKQVDDYPYGGGPGMILKAEPFFKAVEFLKKELTDSHIILMTPQGSQFDQEKAKALAQKSDIVFLCGHYKGVDERVRKFLTTEEISIGDFILTGGELAAMVVVDSIVRLIPGVIGDFDSAKSDSFEQDLLDCPYYTRPENLNGMQVPEVLLSGHHAEIEKWRKEKSLEQTKNKREDLFKKHEVFTEN